MRRHLLSLLGVVLAAGTAEAATCPAAASFTTADGEDGEAHITVGIEGGMRRFVLDTGAPVSVLRESVVEELGLPRTPIPLNMMTGVAGRPFEAATQVERVDLGGLALEKVPFLVQPRTHAAEPDSAGLIGAGLFAKYDLELDFAGHRIAFLAPGSCRPAGMAGMPLDVEPSFHVLVPVELDGARVDALIDSGAARSLMMMGAAHRLFGVAGPSAGDRPIGKVIAADGGSVDAYAHLFRSLTIGPATLSSVAVILMEDETQRVHRPLTDGAGGAVRAEGGGGLPDFVLGMAQLRRLHLIVAYQEKRLYVAEAGS